MRNLVILGGNSHPKLVDSICRSISAEKSLVSSMKFSNGETQVMIKESVREKDVFVVQSACGNVNDTFIELLIMVSACKTASAGKVTVVLPLFPYSRQPDLPYDRADKSPSVRAGEVKVGYRQWTAQAGTLIASLLTSAGADHVITMDLHDPQFQGFFDIPVDNLYGKPLIQQYITQNIPDYQSAVIVSPDAGGAKRATAIADSLEMAFALVHKENKQLDSNASNILVGDVEDQVAIIIDDIIDTAGTVVRAARLLREQGATKVYAVATHGIFSGDGSQRLLDSEIDQVVVTNSTPQEAHQEILKDKLVVLDVSRVFGEAIRRIHNGESVSMLFDHT